MGDLDRDCPGCGSDDVDDRVFVRYTPSPNDAQQELDWAADLPELRGFACTDCGCVLGVISVRDLDERGSDEVQDRASEFRVDEELR